MPQIAKSFFPAPKCKLLNDFFLQFIYIIFNTFSLMLMLFSIDLGIGEQLKELLEIDVYCLND
jgi:hypothetical protein